MPHSGDNHQRIEQCHIPKWHVYYVFIRSGHSNVCSFIFFGVVSCVFVCGEVEKLMNFWLCEFTRCHGRFDCTLPCSTIALLCKSNAEGAPATLSSQHVPSVLSSQSLSPLLPSGIFVRSRWFQLLEMCSCLQWQELESREVVERRGHKRFYCSKSDQSCGALSWWCSQLPYLESRTLFWRSDLFLISREKHFKLGADWHILS